MKLAATLCLVIPAYNESTRLLTTLQGLIEVLPALLSERPFTWIHIVVVDDGSPDPVELPQLNLPPKIQVHRLRHPINLGQGASLQTGIQFGRDKLASDFFVTLDADGQHDPGDLSNLLSPVLDDRADIAFGNRFGSLAPVNMPTSRKAVLGLASAFERVLTGLKLNDAHNGYRAFNRVTALAIQLRQNRMAHATEIKQIVATRRLRYAEVPVRIRYSAESLKKGQSSLAGTVILKDLLKLYLFER